MKHIYLLRHAKSEWDEPYQTDEERGLAERGKKQTKALRSFLHDYEIDVDLAFVSPAERTKRTYQALRKEILRLPKPDFKEAIYEAEEDDLLFLLHGVPDSVRSVMIVGHNPGLESFANAALYGAPDPSRFHKFPTASFLGLTCDKDSWKELTWGSCLLNVFWIPGRLGKE
ncbi:SixA phosphatase family protein [Leptospira idonii]|uniref:Histidine phosphatase family protein n=1 Tax=Leptospira idonii TaxID=1193500 RepID=A0A4R9M1I7_9LEPT|nr:histidine phosphatase family protein [Leptospira idonii]TGN19831.1 histidine phosphatase family protein [Leptospira idonii]